MGHIFPLQVYYEDTDMAGIVYHANYLKYIERARSDWVALHGIDQLALRSNGVVFVVRRIEADFLSPARFGDRLVVRTLVESMSRVRLLLQQQVLRESTVLLDARVTVVCATLAGKPVVLPEVLRDTTTRFSTGGGSEKRN